jgi:hypothetical protein
MALIVHVVEGEIRLIGERNDTTSAHLARLFPSGDVYVRFYEPQGMQWRILQRGTRTGEMKSYYDALLPLNVEQLPEIVQVVHACTN